MIGSKGDSHESGLAAISAGDSERDLTRLLSSLSAPPVFSAASSIILLKRLIVLAPDSSRDNGREVVVPPSQSIAKTGCYEPQPVYWALHYERFLPGPVEFSGWFGDTESAAEYRRALSASPADRVRHFDGKSDIGAVASMGQRWAVR
jgi:hypothetical protein